MPTTTTDKPHAGRLALVTGAARGIGQAIAVGLAKQGATVVIGDVGDLSGTAAWPSPTTSRGVSSSLLRTRLGGSQDRRSWPMVETRLGCEGSTRPAMSYPR